MDATSMEAQTFKKALLISSSLLVAFASITYTTTYLSTFQQAARTASGEPSPVVALGLPGVLLMLSFNMALAGYMILSIGHLKTQTLTAYANVSFGLMALAILILFAGAKPRGVQHWLLTALLAIIYSPVLLGACKVMYSLLNPIVLLCKRLQSKPPDQAHASPPSVDSSHPPVGTDGNVGKDIEAGTGAM